jgi:hypothetical protein
VCALNNARNATPNAMLFEHVTQSPDILLLVKLTVQEKTILAENKKN